MNILTKRGNLDNVVTYEHVCDEISDLPNIPSDQISLGSVAIVLKGENGGLEVYMADSNKKWSLLSGSVGGGSSGGSDSSSESATDDNVLIVHFNTTDGINWTCDKTYNEITSFMQSDPNHRVESPGYIIGSWNNTQVKADRTRAWGIQFIHIEMQGFTGPGGGDPYFNLTLIMLVLFEDNTIVKRTKTIS